MTKDHSHDQREPMKIGHYAWQFAHLLVFAAVFPAFVIFCPRQAWADFKEVVE